jgi:hypothetical protein
VTRIRRAALGVWDFVVGDDWISAAGVVLGIGVTALVASAGIPAWWVLPLAIIAILALSLRRAAG